MNPPFYIDRIYGEHFYSIGAAASWELERGRREGKFNGPTLSQADCECLMPEKGWSDCEDALGFWRATPVISHGGAEVREFGKLTGGRYANCTPALQVEDTKPAPSRYRTVL